MAKLFQIASNQSGFYENYYYYCRYALWLNDLICILLFSAIVV